MNLSELKKKSPPDLLTMAADMGIENISRSRKQEVIFSILKSHPNRSCGAGPHFCHMRATSTKSQLGCRATFWSTSFFFATKTTLHGGILTHCDSIFDGFFHRFWTICSKSAIRADHGSSITWNALLALLWSLNSISQCFFCLFWKRSVTCSHHRCRLRRQQVDLSSTILNFFGNFLEKMNLQNNKNRNPKISN